MGSLRKPAVSGSFYPLGKEELLAVLGTFFKKTRRIISGKKEVRAIVVPHAGYVYSGQTAAWGYSQLSKEKRCFVLIGPSHSFAFDGLCASQASYWDTPLGKAQHTAWRSKNPLVFFKESIHVPEHSLEVQLPFLQYLHGKDFSFSAFLTGTRADSKKAAEFFLRMYPESIFIFSSDLSHYLPEKEALKKDRETIQAILRFDAKYFLHEENVACGAVGIGVLLAMARKEGWQAKLIFSDTSATASGDERGVVGYGAIVFY